MNAIKCHMVITSDTITIPELSGFIGKSVEIIFIEDSEFQSENSITKLRELKNQIKIDEDSVVSLREASKL